MRIISIVGLMLLLFATGCACTKMNYGRFEGTVKAEFLRDPQRDVINMKLLEDFTYVDPYEKRWTAKKGYETDGASIPKVFWSIVGGPFEGAYREPAVIHDWYCDSKTETWKDVHRIFYYANRAAGLTESKSKLLYAAVRLGGPKWGSDSSNCYNCHDMKGYQKDKNGTLVNIPEIAKVDADKIEKWVNSANPELEDIDKYIEEYYPKSRFGH